jgi:hypothetical protein
VYRGGWGICSLEGGAARVSILVRLDGEISLGREFALLSSLRIAMAFLFGASQFKCMCALTCALSPLQLLPRLEPDHIRIASILVVICYAEQIRRDVDEGFIDNGEVALLPNSCFSCLENILLS